MTLKELKKEARKLLRECNKCCDNSHEITIDGNGYNASEAYGGIKYLVDLINKTKETSVTDPRHSG